VRDAMTKDETKDAICQHVAEAQGCKATELAVALWQAEDLSSLIAELVSEGRLTEVEYVLPNLNYRAKSFLLPGNTSITLSGFLEPTAQRQEESHLGE